MPPPLFPGMGWKRRGQARGQGGKGLLWGGGVAVKVDDKTLSVTGENALALHLKPEGGWRPLTRQGCTSRPAPA
ncbi:hypothetical protein [Serratia odorifera]|uniref:hypothetical protein n=1 Tax=Serratia odorifera TaxID=618 RepID=UPI000FDBDAAE|nr:hypothetical protein [Serratia odorifera]